MLKNREGQDSEDFQTDSCEHPRGRAARCAGHADTTLQEGIDVSHYDEAVDFTQVRAVGMGHKRSIAIYVKNSIIDLLRDYLRFFYR